MKESQRLRLIEDQAKTDPGKKLTRFNYTSGPMLFIGQQIVRAMQDAGHDAFIHCQFRSAADQDAAFRRKASRVRAWQSPHQYGEAVDIVHRERFWDAPKVFWDHLHASGHMVAEKFGVKLTYGYDWGWDLAHIEIKDWHDFKYLCRDQTPTQHLLDTRFAEVLPKVWKQHQASVSYHLRSDDMSDADVAAALACLPPDT